MKKSTVFKKIGFFAVTLMLVALMIVASVSLVAAGEEYSDVKYSSASLSIDGSINLKFYITDLGSLDDVEGAYLAVRIPDEHGNYSVHKMTTDDLIEDGNRHVLVLRLAAAQQTESISVQLIIPGASWSGKVFTYSVSKYNNKVLELARDNDNANQAAYKEVAIPLKAMLNYGAMAQTEFGYNTDNKANEGVYSNEDNKNPADVVGADHFKDVPGTEKTVVGDVQVAGIQAQYKSEINAFVFIKSPLEKPVVTVELEHKEAYTVRSKDIIKLNPGEGLDSDDGWYQIVIRNIPAHLLDKKMTITAKVNDNNQASLTCSMLNYFENLIVNTPEGVKPESVRTAQALYNFHMAMKSYMGEAPEVEVVECSHKDADGNLINYYIEVLAPATCQHAGRQIKVCSLCDEQIEGTEEQIAKAEHKYSTVVDTLPTCTAEGTQHKKCDNCDATMAMDNIPMLDHSFEDEAEVVTEATCTTDGVMTAKCKFCGTASDEQIVIPAFGHDFDYANSEITTEPGCTTAGERTYYCNNEGCTATKVEAVVALGHTYGAEGRTEPTCDTPGSINTTCTVCGEGVEQAIPATGHKYSKATCDTPATCTVCQATKGEALGHKTTKATCTAPEVCYVCKQVIAEASGQDHDWGEGVIGAGKITYTCNECNATKAELIVSFAIDPVYATAGENVVLTVRLINNPGIWATRFEIPVNTNVFEFVGASGSMFDTYECGLEGNKIVYFAYNNAIANVYDEIVVQITLKTKADIHEGSQGSYQFKALPTEGNTTNVEKQVIENIQSSGTTVTIKGHIFETIPGKAMTCAEDGLTDGIVCRDCGMVIKAQEVIVASGHDAPEATCTEDGVCTVCNQIVNPAPGHTFDPFTAACACGETADRGVNVVFEKNNLKDVATNDKYEITVTEDGVKFVEKAYTDSNIIFFENKGDVETGKYLFFKYRSEGIGSFQVFTSDKASVASGDYNFMHSLINDGEWYIAVIEVPKLEGTEDGKYFVKQLRIDAEGEAGSWIEFAYVGYAASVESIVTYTGDEIEDCCGHGLSTDLDVYEVIGDGSGEMYATKCAVCGVKLRSKITIYGGFWNNQIEDGETVENGVSVGAGWVSVAGGFKEAHFTITNVNDPTETAVVVVPFGQATYAHDSWPGKLGAWEDRTWININLTIADWANVNDVDFNGDTVTISCELVLRKDPTAPTLTWRIANVANKNSATVTVKYHEHTPGEAAEEVITAPTCTATGTKALTVRCTECNAVVSQTTEEVPATGHTAAGSDGEFCSVCRTFINADPSNYFNFFWGGANVPNGGAYVGIADGSAYGVYTVTRSDYRTQLISNGSPTISTRYLIIKYKVEGQFQLGLFASTKQTGINGSYYLNKTLVEGGWQYAILDLTTTASSGVVANGDGQYLLQHLTVDYDLYAGASATAEIAYIALAATADDVVNGIKAIEGVEYINQSYCPCNGFLQVGTALDINTHAPVCSLCGKQGTAEKHTGATCGVWNAELGYYEATCTVCNGKYNYGSTIYAEAENMTIGQGAWNSAQYNGTEGNIGYAAISSNNGTGTWAETYFPLNNVGAVTGQYLVFKYKVPGTIANNTLTLNRIDGNSNTVVTAPLVADGEWHIGIIDMGTKGFNANSVLSDATRINLYGWAAGETIYFDWFRMYDDASRIPDEFRPECDHENVKENVDQGNGTHADICQDCFKAINVEAHTGAGLNGEFCSECQTFINVDPSTVFNKFYGGASIPAVANVTSGWSANGYRLYTRTAGGEAYLYPSYDGSETGQYMVLKYKATGSFYMDFYTNTSGAGATGSGDYMRYKPSVYNEWQYLIIDFSTLSKVEADANGKYAIKYLRFDVQTATDVGDRTGTGTLEIAYFAYANSLEKLINGIKAVDGVDSLTATACPHLSEYVEWTVTGTEHSRECNLCGKVLETGKHSGANSATWDAEKQQYVSNTPCEVCGETYNLYFNVLTTSGNTSCLNGASPVTLGKSDETSSSFMHFTFDKGTTAAAWKPTAINCNPDGAVSGQYMVIKYRVPAEYAGGYRIEVCTPASATPKPDGSGVNDNRTTVINYGGFTADDEWHIIIVDLSVFTTAFKPNEDGTYTVSGTYWVQPSYSSLASGSMDIEYIAFADSLDRMLAGIAAYDADITPTSGVCPCPSFALKGAVDKCQTVCAICGKVAETFGDVHTLVEATAIVPDCINDGRTEGMQCTTCGYTTCQVIPSTGVCNGGSDGEYCKGCHTFLNANPSDYFTYFWGGLSAPNTTNSSYKGQSSVNGYNVYTVTKTDYRHQLIATDNPIAGRYLVVKYLLVEGEMILGTFPTTRQTGINGSYTYNHRLEAGGWKYLIIDLKEKTVNGGVQLSEDGNVYLKHLSVDYDLAEGSSATAQFAYMALATTFENAIAGINAIEGTEAIRQDYCLHSAGTNDLDVYEVIGDGSGKMYTGTCAACGAKAGVTTITPYKNWWDTEIVSGQTYANGDLVISGWVSVAGGWKDAIFTITNANDPSETTTVVVPVGTKSYDNASWPSVLGPAAERRKIDVYLTVDDWSDVNGFNFSGDDVTISLALVLNKDPEAAPIPYKVNRAGAMSVTIKIQSAHQHTAGAATSENEVAATCGAAGSYDMVVRCTECNEIISTETTTVPATGDHRSESTESTCLVCGQTYDKYVNVLWDKYLLAGEMAYTSVTPELTETGAKFTASMNASQYGNNILIIEDHPTGVSNAEYFFIKYKAEVGTDLYIGVDFIDGAWTWLDQYVIEDGEWHVMVYKTGATTAKTFKIYFNTTSADVTPTIEVAYAGFAHTEEQVNAFVEAKGDTKYMCDHRSASTEHNDDYTAICTVCGQTYQKYVDTLWDKYLLAGDMAYTGVTPELTETGAKFTAPHNAEQYGNSVLIIEGHSGVPNAEYMFIKYKAEVGTTFEIGLQSAGANWIFMSEATDIVADGDWHVIVFQCYTGSASTFKFYLNAAEGETATVEVAYAGFAHTEEQVNAFVAAN
ncbi:MAG: hypothetical protein IKA62_02650 [Clostridia bacterium]|nr:hypothetical protein [Clostridia bacterium]